MALRGDEEGYQEFKRAAEGAAPEGLSLRDKNRFLWGKSFCEQLKRNVVCGFRSSASDGEAMEKAAEDG